MTLVKQFSVSNDFAWDLPHDMWQMLWYEQSAVLVSCGSDCLRGCMRLIGMKSACILASLITALTTYDSCRWLQSLVLQLWYHHFWAILKLLICVPKGCHYSPDSVDLSHWKVLVAVITIHYQLWMNQFSYSLVNALRIAVFIAFYSHYLYYSWILSFGKWAVANSLVKHLHHGLRNPLTI